MDGAITNFADPVRVWGPSPWGSCSIPTFAAAGVGVGVRVGTGVRSRDGKERVERRKD